MNELVVISGKGGTGKTSLIASFAALADSAVLVDCDVDAADWHLILQPRIVRREKFSGGSRARIMPGHCTACGKCEELCRFDAIFYDGPGSGRAPKTFRVDPMACDGCGVCAWFCADSAIEFGPTENGQWFVSETRHGPLVHAKLDVGAENSGKLVTRLRHAAQQIAIARDLGLILGDGSPGIGCPVIASLTGASLALIVVEPTMSGQHDFERIGRLAMRLRVPALMAVNKADLNMEITGQLEAAALALGIQPVGRVPYDPAVTQAQIDTRSVVETSTGPATQAITAVWDRVVQRLQTSRPAQHDGLVHVEVPGRPPGPR